MEKKALSDYFGVNPDNFKGISIELLDFPVRISNCLHRYQIETIEDLLMVGWDDINGWRNLGKGSINTLEEMLKQFFSGKEQAIPSRGCILPQHIIDSVVRYEPVDINSKILSLSQMRIVKNYNDAIAALDKNDIEILLSDSEYCRELIEFLSTASNKLKAAVVQTELMDKIPDGVRKMPAQEVLSLYSDNYAFIYELIDEKVDASFETVLITNCEKWISNKSFQFFYNWLEMDLANAAKDLFLTGKFNEKMIEILNERAKGKTLEQVGNKIGVTRERIRQIESKGIRCISLWDAKNRITKILALRYHDCGYISTTELTRIFGTYGNVIFYYFRTLDSKLIRFERDYDGFAICSEDLFRELQIYIDSLPDIIRVSDCDVPEGKNYPPELFRRGVLAQYNITGNVYHRSRLTLTSIYSEVLRIDYPDGIHVYDDKELNSFRKKVEERYGDIKISSTNRALGVRIADIGILCGRGTYRSKKAQYITQDLADRIYDYLIKGDLPAYLTNTIFAKFENELIEQGIDNKYYLQGVIREIYGDKFMFRRDYIIKDPRFTNISSALIDFVSKSNAPVSRREICERFPGITEIVINLAMTDSRILNLFGSYLATSHIELTAEEVDYLKELADKYTASGNSIHCKEIYNEVCNNNKTMLTRNYIFQPFGIYGLLEYLFQDEFNFDRPYIARKDVEIEKTIDYLYSKVCSSDIVELEDLSAVAKEKHFQLNSMISFANSCNGTHLLISNHQMASMDYLNVDENVAKQVEEIIVANISGTIPIGRLTCIHLFPKISIPWNEWIIYSMLNKMTTLLEVGLSSNQIKQAVPFVSLKGLFEFDAMSSISNRVQTGVSIADDMDNIDALIEEIIDDEIVF